MNPAVNLHVAVCLVLKDCTQQKCFSRSCRKNRYEAFDLCVISPYRLVIDCKCFAWSLITVLRSFTVQSSVCALLPETGYNQWNWLFSS